MVGLLAATSPPQWRLGALTKGFFIVLAKTSRDTQKGIIEAAPETHLQKQIEVNLASGTEDVPHQAVPVKLTGVRRPSPGIAELTFKVQRARTFRFLAGQRAVLRAASGRTRALPIASCPCDGTTLRFLMSSHCADPLLRPILAQWPDDTARPHTQRFVLEGPEGDFVLSENSPNPLVFVSQDEGFGAINSLLEHALNLELGQPIFLLRLASDKAHFFAHNFCRSLADAYDNLTYWQDTIDPARDCGPGPYVAFATRTISRLSKLQAPFVYVSGSKEFCNAIQCVFEQGPVQAGRAVALSRPARAMAPRPSYSRR